MRRDVRKRNKKRKRKGRRKMKSQGKRKKRRKGRRRRKGRIPQKLKNKLWKNLHKLSVAVTSEGLGWLQGNFNSLLNICVAFNFSIKTLYYFLNDQICQSIMKMQASLERAFLPSSFLCHFFPAKYISRDSTDRTFDFHASCDHSVPSVPALQKQGRREWSPSKLYPVTPNTDTIHLPHGTQIVDFKSHQARNFGKLVLIYINNDLKGMKMLALCQVSNLRILVGKQQKVVYIKIVCDVSNKTKNQRTNLDKPAPY